MAKFNVTLHDGRKVQVEADSPQHADLAAGEYAQANPPPAKTGGLGGIAKNFVGNVPVGLAQVADMAMSAVPGFGLADQVMSGNPLGVPSLRHPTGTALTRIAAHLAPKPQSVPEEYARTAGQMLPAALAPGSVPARIANVVLPTLGSETAGQVARALGGSQAVEQAARMLGGLFGGGAASIRLTPRPAPTATLPPRVLADTPSTTPNSASRAASYVRKVAKSSGVTPEQLAAAPEGRLAAEALGRSGQTALGALARQEGATGDALNAEVATRQTERPTQLLDAFAKQTGIAPDAASGDIAAVVKRGREAAAPLYEEAYAHPAMDSSKLQVLAARPSIQGAMSRAVRIAAEEGRDPAELGFRMVHRGDGSTPRNAAVTAPKLVDGRYQVTGSAAVHDPRIADVAVQVENPTPQTWDYVKRGLDDVLNTYRDKTTGKLRLDEEGRAVLDTLNQFRHELTTANPAYAKALQTSGDYLSADQSFREGDRFLFNQNVTEQQFGEKLGKLTGANQEAFRGGIANKLFDMAQNGKLDPKVFKAPRVQAKLRMALGDDAAAKLLDHVQQQGEMQGFERRYAPGANSITAEMRAAMQEQDEGGALHQAMNDFLENAVHRGPVKAALGAATKGVARGVAAARTPGMSVPARDAAGRMLMMSPQELSQFLSTAPPVPPSLTLSGPAGGLFGATARLGRHAPQGQPPAR